MRGTQPRRSYYNTGASRSKAQMVVPHGAVRATVPITTLLTPCSWRLLGTHEVCPAIPKIVRACSHSDCLLEALSAEVTALGLLW